jgi:hypothetical protein
MRSVPVLAAADVERGIRACAERLAELLTGRHGRQICRN